MRSEQELTEQIRKSLPHAWAPFFSRYGKLTEIQRMTIPIVLRGKNVVIASPTASGKTEAVVAPLAEMFVKNGWKNLAVLFVVPTRALANDTLCRIEGPLSEMTIRVALKHGDKPVLRKTPDFLITTPESLDSLLSRRPEIFANLSAVVLDEIHLLDNSYRGDQLRVLLKRLQKVVANSFLTYLLSATLYNPSEIGSRYMDEFETVVVEGRREIETTYLNSISEVINYAKSNKLLKVLVFCNYRETVERIGAELEPLWRPYPVVVHHGSLDRIVREEAEEVMKSSRCAVCVATSTLEIGIDIGNIDLVVLAEPPFSLSSLIQRIGRGNRRSNKTKAAVVIHSDEEKELLSIMFQDASQGTLPNSRYAPDFSVIIQQIFSYLFQHRGGRSEKDLIELFSFMCSEEINREILSILQNKKWIECRGGRWFATDKLMDEGEIGMIHSNIPDNQTYTVTDASSGNPIGVVSGLVDRSFLLGQRKWRVVSVSKDIIKVQRSLGSAEAPLFQHSNSQGKYTTWLPTNLRKRTM